MWSLPPQYGIPNAFGMPYQQGNFMATGFSSSPIEVPRPCTTPEVEGLDNICLDTNSEKGKEVEPKRRSKAKAMPWTHEEDVLLCQAFCTISSDPVIGAQQTSEVFWRQITQYYNEASQARNLIQRTIESTKSHFYVFHGDCLKFNASINRFRADQISDENDAIVLQNALMEWNSEGKKKGGFKWLHCWEVLKKKMPNFMGHLRHLQEERKLQYLTLGITLLVLGKMLSLAVMLRKGMCVDQLAKKQQRRGREKEKQLQEEAPVQVLNVC
ncbi:Unknown protein [Striga hermonthica]|uniref:No apical meristem-associated C-terminal domain-containing protein n=1 Tax=Striga hermonthica TaxID=68872 RepID=A0A9N7MGK6_STRHE|nr:Unknown protein [Striga hermonthica]